jgi:phospholipid transport system substrate-binding protein
MKRRASFIVAALLSAAVGAAGAAEVEIATDTPRATVETLHRGLVAAARDAGKAPVAERFHLLEPVVAATHDLPYIAEFALRRQWPSLSASERERFVEAFERLSVTTYASRFRGITADTFTLTGEKEAAGGRVQVDAAIVRPDADAVPLEYLLEQRDGAWRIINIVADGVSDLALKRAEYQRLLADGTVEDLIDDLEAQAARLE